MDISGKTIWQQAAGDTNRNYTEQCLNWGVILNGPGHAGKWPDCKQQLHEENLSARKITDMKRFAEEMQNDDIVVLRGGTVKVLGVGQIVVLISTMRNLETLTAGICSIFDAFGGCGLGKKSSILTP